MISQNNCWPFSLVFCCFAGKKLLAWLVCSIMCTCTSLKSVVVTSHVPLALTHCILYSLVAVL